MDMQGNNLTKKYELGHLLGRGTFAKVYKAKHIHTGENVAIKVMEKEKIMQVGMIEQIKREISVMHLVQHPNIVRLHEVMASKTKIYFVMDFVKGGELFDKVAKGRLNEEEARKYFQQLISAVDFCHSRGVFHRDLKPENLLLDENGNLKVSDFGLSALPEQLQKDGLLHTTCGTPAYAAPEIITSKGYDGAKADIWSCGVVLFVLVAGYLPFHETNLLIMYRKICKGDFQCPPWLSREVRNLIIQLMDPNPKTRITIKELMKNAWFRKGFKTPLAQTQNNLSVSDIEDVFEEASKPASLNAFEIISLSPGFDLSGLFDKSMKQRSRFMSMRSASNIVAKLEEFGKMLSFDVKRSKDCKVKLQKQEQGRKGRLSIDAEVFQVTPELYIVELHKSAGDTLEYNQICNQQLRPALKDILCDWNTTDSAASK